MGKISTTGGAGGPGSDECTARLSDIPAGLKAVTADSNDEAGAGTMTMIGNAQDTYVYPGKTYYNTDPKVKRTGTMLTQAAITITPGTGAQTIAAGRYLTGALTIQGDANLVSANIIAGKRIFGKAGSRHYIDKIGKTYNYDGYTLPSDYSEKIITIDTPETANYPYILAWWGCGGGAYFPLGGAGSVTDRVYLDFTGGIVYKIYMKRPTLTSLQVVFTKTYGYGYGSCNTANVRICAGSDVAFN